MSTLYGIFVEYYDSTGKIQIRRILSHEDYIFYDGKLHIEDFSIPENQVICVLSESGTDSDYFAEKGYK